MNGGLNYMLDGGTHDDPENNLNLPLPFPDALQEFKVEMNGLVAQYGHHAAGTINAVTKSGTNGFHGDVFEFVRNSSMNAENFYAKAPDGLKRNQFGGTFGGPIVRNKLFFFGGEQTTTLRSLPSVNRSFVPTAKMLSGDFTDLASGRCQNQKPVTLRAPFGANGIANIVDPKLFSPQALALVNDPRFPRSTDPCGLTQFGGVNNLNEYLTIGRVDYQKSEKHSMLARYMGARKDQPWDFDGKYILTSSQGQVNQRTHTLVFGDTYLIGNGIVNSVHLTAVRTLNPRISPNVIDLSEIGVKNVWIPFPGHMYLTVGSGLAGGIAPNGFSVSGVNVQPGYYNSIEGQASEDVSWIRGAHQYGFGGYYSHMNFTANSNVAANPNFTFSGNRTSTNNPNVPDGTGLALSDFLLGLPSSFSAGTKSELYPRQTYVSLYAQDSWKFTRHLTANYGVRWEPFISPYDGHGRHNYFSYALYNSGYQSTSYPLAPMGTVMSGDALATSDGKYVFSRLLHFVPRLGFAWDPKGDGMMVVRAAYGMFSDLPPLWTFYGNGAGSPWNGTTSLTNPAFSDPWNLPSATYATGYPGGNPLPATFTKTTPFQLNGGYDNLRQNAKSTYINQWNLSIQRQVGQNWLFAANYMGNQDVHLWGPQIQQDYSVYSPGANSGNVPQRKILTLLNPAQGKYYNAIGDLEDGGTGSYHAMLLTVQRRRANGLTVQGNYTLSRCIGDGVVSQPGSGGITPGFRRYNRSFCAGDRTHVVNISTVAESPRFANNALRILGSGWQLSGILKLMSGTSFRVSSGIDTTFTGTTDNGRANQVLANAYLPNKNKDGWLNIDAFTCPDTVTTTLCPVHRLSPAICSAVTISCGYGNAAQLRGPGLINLDMGLTRRFQVHEGQSIEFRAEAFNAPNHVNPMNPSAALNSQTFGKSTAAADPRIMQLALKFVF
jgi:hypothetical protein